ncbi:hypothetical protein AAKU61_004235 [Undibacterium sp. GrIS 1.2]|uniref:hypothetical protein n=1 Tax=Undibacterium sp. GrIS 1.2 TaxID=3143933 RepID=UPI00339B29EB
MTNNQLSFMATAIMNGNQIIDTEHGKKRLSGLTAMIQSVVPVQLLQRVESFLAGFEDDETQEGVHEMLKDIRDVLDSKKRSEK